MADEAFALSPISARAAQPGEADYDAIREAFMETSRGRWFLTEFAKRNRNADTHMVLDAVARIEEALAAQRKPAQDTKLTEALAAIRSAVDQAAGAVQAALTGLALEEHLAPIQKGTRIIREISWRWREIGADGRICDLIDSQAGAIEGSCARIGETDATAALNAAFELIRARIDQFDEHEAGESEDAVARPPEPPKHQPASVAIEAQAVPDQAMPDQATGQAGLAEMAGVAADAHDEAVLAMVAIEMAAPDPSDDFSDDLISEHAVLSPTAEPVTAVEPTAAEPEFSPPHLQVGNRAFQPEQSLGERDERSPQLAETSLGSTIIAAGVLPQPKTASDPLAPIRRMTQAERIAFFS